MQSIRKTLVSLAPASPGSTRRIGRSTADNDDETGSLSSATRSRPLSRKGSKLGAMLFFKRTNDHPGSTKRAEEEEQERQEESGGDVLGTWEVSSTSSSLSPQTRHKDMHSKTAESTSPTPSPRSQRLFFSGRSFRSQSKESSASDNSPKTPKSRSFRHNEPRQEHHPQVEETRRPESHRSMARKPSKLKVIFGGKSERPQIVAMTDEMIRLETVIQSDKGQQMLVQELMSLKGDYVVKVRFCSAVDKFDAATEDTERAALAETLIQTFLMHGCMFYINTLSEARAYAIVIDGNHNQLLDAKREVLDGLSKDANVMRCVDFVEALDGV